MIDSRRLVPAMLASSALNAFARGMVLLLLPIDGLAVGGLFGGFALPGMVSIGSVCMPLLGAVLVSRFGHRPVLMGALTLAALGVAAIAVAAHTLGQALGALVYGVGIGLYTLAKLTYLSDAVHVSERGRVVSAVGGMGRVGMLTGPAAAGLIATWISRDAALVAASGALLAAALLTLLLPTCPTVPSAHPPSHPLAFVTRVIRAHWHTLSQVGSVMLALAFLRSGRMLMIPICGTMLGLDESAVGLAKSASMGVDMLLFYPAGLIMDRKGRKWTAIPCLSILALGVLLVGLAETPMAFVVGAIVAGFGNGLGAGINMTLAGDVSPREGRAEFIGVWTLMTELGALSAPFATGWVAQALALGPAAALLAGVGLTASAFMALVVPEPSRMHARTEPSEVDVERRDRTA